MRHTKHSEIRYQQRGFKKEDLNLILEWGEYKKSYGETKVKIGKKGVKGLRYVLKDNLQRIDKLKDATVVISEEDGVFITMYKN